MNFRDQLIRLGSEQPHLQTYLEPILDSLTKTADTLTTAHVMYDVQLVSRNRMGVDYLKRGIQQVRGVSNLEYFAEARNQSQADLGTTLYSVGHYLVLDRPITLDDGRIPRQAYSAVESQLQSIWRKLSGEDHPALGAKIFVEDIAPIS